MNRKKEERISLEKANLPGRDYMEDKPGDCRFCFWWAGKFKQCKRKTCYYLFPLKEKEADDTELAYCKTCPYGKHFPCIGYCMAKLLQEMREQEQS